jgi:Fe2+ transport system protein FeoA
MKRLSELRVGERGLVRRVEGSVGVRRRLRAMGFVAGTEVAVKRCAPMGDPVAYDLLGYCLSLRREEAAAVLVEPVPVMSLASAPVGPRLRVVRMTGGWGMRRRLAGLGISEGTELTRVSAGDSGPVAVCVDGTARVVGRGMAGRVIVVRSEPGA